MKQKKSNFNFQAYTCLQLNRRTSGRENLFLARRNGTEIQTDGTRYKSWGVGLSTGIDFVIMNKVFFGAEFGASHYFQKNNLKVEPPGTVFYNSYKVNKDLLFVHPKIGILF
ncbi:MAG: hypothetical protein KBB37_12910 [Bacteroidia bacterium]|nr:hypothetical protein [Bacteroidia bacterium]MBP7262177.1 hypothetical protein [Bacteroidia bacterium]MBP9181379.1 hypothetical protein [Bacteroidia bacterium]MBP9725668.1 hypothetical protein [Bacteroidia bacterium]